MKSKPHVLESLNRQLPMSVNNEGLALVFTRKLTRREVTQVFDLFPVVAGIETPEGYYLRSDWPDAEALHPDCVAAKIATAIKQQTKSRS